MPQNTKQKAGVCARACSTAKPACASASSFLGTAVGALAGRRSTVASTRTAGQHREDSLTPQRKTRLPIEGEIKNRVEQRDKK